MQPLLSLVWHCRTITIECEPDTDRRTRYHVSIDGIAKLQESILAGYQLGLTLGNTTFAIWGHVHMVSFDLVTERTHRWEDPYDLAAVYFRDNTWIVVSELAVDTWTEDHGTHIGHYDHYEVILTVRWDGDILVIEDFQGDRFRFNVPSLTRA